MATRLQRSVHGSNEAVINIVRRISCENLREEQLKVVVAFLSGKDVIVSLPATAYGKSIHI